MASYRTYQAKADATRAKELAATTSPFTIDVRFVGGLTATQRTAFTKAADRWTTAIVGDLPSVSVDGEVVDDVLILAQGVAIDGPGKILGQAGPTHLRPGSAGKAARSCTRPPTAPGPAPPAVRWTRASTTITSRSAAGFSTIRAR